MRLKLLTLCKCGHAYFELPEQAVESPKYWNFECVHCKQPVRLSKAIYTAILLNNCMPKNLPEDEEAAVA